MLPPSSTICQHLLALEFGRVLDGKPDDEILPIDESSAFILDEPEGVVVGFIVNDYSKFELPESHPRDEVPLSR